MIKKNLTSSIILVMMLLITPCVSAQTYRQIKGWSKEVNEWSPSPFLFLSIGNLVKLR